MRGVVEVSCECCEGKHVVVQWSGPGNWPVLIVRSANGKKAVEVAMPPNGALAIASMLKTAAEHERRP